MNSREQNRQSRQEAGNRIGRDLDEWDGGVQSRDVGKPCPGGMRNQAPCRRHRPPRADGDAQEDRVAIRQASHIHETPGDRAERKTHKRGDERQADQPDAGDRPRAAAAAAARSRARP